MNNGMEETRDFLREALEGDPAARNRLFGRIRQRIVIWVSARLSPRLRCRLEPEDVAQEVLSQANQSLETFRGADMKSFHRWLFRIAENRIRDLADHWSAQKRQPGLPVEPSQTTPGTHLMRSEQAALLMQALQELPEDYREVILLRKIEEVDTAEAAERMGRNENSIRILLCRALNRLREIMGADDPAASGIA